MLRVFASAQAPVRLFGLERRLPSMWRESVQRRGELRPLVREGLAELSDHRPASVDELARVHPSGYPDDQIIWNGFVNAVRLSWLSVLPMKSVIRGLRSQLLDKVGATIAAARAAIDSGTAASLDGGFGLASARRGSGLEICSDIAVALAALWRDKAHHEFLIIDVDARQGTGYAGIFRRERRVRILDAHVLCDLWSDAALRERIDYPVLVSEGCGDRRYLGDIEPAIAAALAAWRCDLVVYLAGTNVLEGLPGSPGLSVDGVMARDRLVIEAVRRRGLPLVVLPAGGGGREAGPCRVEALRCLALAAGGVAAGVG